MDVSGLLSQGNKAVSSALFYLKSDNHTFCGLHSLHLIDHLAEIFKLSELHLRNDIMFNREVDSLLHARGNTCAFALDAIFADTQIQRGHPHEGILRKSNYTVLAGSHFLR